MTARLTMLLLVTMVAAVIGTGCGGGDSSGDESSSSSGASSAGSTVTVTTSTLSKDEFVAQASKACQHLRKDLFERVLAYIKQHEPKNSSRAEETAVFAAMTKAVLLPTIRKEIAAIRELGAPSGEEGEVEELLTSEQEAVDTVANLKHIVSRFEIERYFTDSEKLFRAYGLDACANE